MPNCPHCAFENLPTAAFCVNCGRDLSRQRDLTLSLQATHSLNPADPTSPSSRAPEAERRFVTVLFADLSGFTALSETRDPETVRELINACFDRLLPILE